MNQMLPSLSFLRIERRDVYDKKRNFFFYYNNSFIYISLYTNF